MPSSSLALAVPESLRELVAQLPFDLDDSEQAGAAFRRWRTATEEPADDTAAARKRRAHHKRVVDLWTYCFLRRYFLAKFAAQRAAAASDFDEVVEDALRKVEAHRDDVRDPMRYPHWVSVVCKHTFLNYVRRRHPSSVSIDHEEAPQLPAPERVQGDLGLSRQVVAKAIERLPEYLRPVARKRFLEEESYKKISEKTELALPTVRAYASRARDYLREDPDVRALWGAPGP